MSLLFLDLEIGVETTLVVVVALPLPPVPVSLPCTLDGPLCSRKSIRLFYAAKVSRSSPAVRAAKLINYLGKGDGT